MVSRVAKAKKSAGGKRKNGGKNMKAILKQTNKKILSQDPNHQWEIDTIGPIHLAWGKKKSKKANGQLVKKYYSKLCLNDE